MIELPPHPISLGNVHVLITCALLTHNGVLLIYRDLLLDQFASVSVQNEVNQYESVENILD